MIGFHELAAIIICT